MQSFSIRLALLLVNFGTGVIVARSLAPVGRGEQAAISLWPIFFAGLATMGIPLALNYESRRRPTEASRLYFVAVLAVVIIGFGAGAMGVGIMPLLLRDYDHKLVREAQLLMVFTPAWLLTYLVRAYLESRGEFLRSMLSQFVPNVITLMSLLILAFSHHLTPVICALAYLVPVSAQTLWIAYRLSRHMKIQLGKFGEDIRVLFGYGLRSYGSDIVTALSTQLDLAIIVGFLSPVALGLYTVALSLTRLINIVQQSMVMVLFPHASGLELDEAIELVARAARLSTLCSILLSMLLMLVVPVALPVVYGTAFVAALAIIPLLAAEAVLSGLAWVLMQGFLATGRPSIATFVQVCWLVITLGLLLLFVPRMNMAGAALALLASSVVRIVLIFLAYWIMLDRAAPRLILDGTDVMYVRSKLRGLAVRQSAVLAD